MLHYDRTDISEGIDVNKTSESKVWYFSPLLFVNKGFKFQLSVSNVCHDLLMSLNVRDIAILNIKSADYCCIISGISKSKAINLMQNIYLIKKVEHYKT